MARPGITQDDVYQAAQDIAEAGAFPTISSVHAKLGTGSLGTIHKHLLAWKQERLLAPALKFETGKDAIKVKTIVNEKIELETVVQKQVTQNVAMSARLLSLEQENTELKAKLTTALDKIQGLSAENSDLIAKIATHDALLAELKVAHTETLNIILADKNSEIESLKSELKTVHLASVEMVRKTSFEGQDLLMIERVKTINLSDQLKALNAKIAQVEQKLTLSPKATKGEAILQKTKPELKSYTLDEIYADKPLDKKKPDEDVA